MGKKVTAAALARLSIVKVLPNTTVSHTNEFLDSHVIDRFTEANTEATTIQDGERSCRAGRHQL